MFKRATPLSPLQHLKEIFWPTMGYWRALKYSCIRVIRLSDTNHKIAGGLATGVGISFTPIVGTHFIQAGIISYITRTNLMASLVGTFAGNPWTFPFMWWAAISFGSFLFGLVGLPTSTALPDEMSFSIFWGLLTHEPLRIFLPWMLGGYLLGILSWPVSYLIFFQLVKGAKIARKQAHLLRIKQAAKEVTGRKKS